VAHHVHATARNLKGGLPPVTHSAIVGGDEHERSVAAKARDDWIEAGVVARRGLPLAAVLAEWDDVVTGMDDRGATTCSAPSAVAGGASGSRWDGPNRRPVRRVRRRDRPRGGLGDLALT